MEKDYKGAVAYYEMIAFFGQGNSSLTLQALTNAAALRLRVATIQPIQIPAAIFECTRALEIDPNNVEALFRRGLGLALAQRWTQAISGE